MNVNSTNSFSSWKVVSKYFSSNPVMDESLSEFKEKKGCCTGPKTSQKSTTDKVNKQRKIKKRVKGQKDIRAALKSKKVEQVAYAQEFDEVCKQAGVDVDSEQLQLAIALSKSLGSSEDIQSNASQKPLSSQERTKKIRSTLLEYGFAVPEIKINKRLKNRKKQYKLLLAKETEKQQIISDRYAQVLFGNNLSHKAVNNQDVDFSLGKCYSVATEVTYMTLQDNSIFYVDDLVDRCTSKGSLLKDWANIPGRPESPVNKETFSMNISEIECSQEELDIVLSGTLKSAKDVVKKKVEITRNTPIIVIDVDNKTNPEPLETGDDENDTTLLNGKTVNTESTVSSNTILLISDRVRSCSPDIFDDEVSLILDSNNDSNNKSEKSKIEFDVLKDLTENDVVLLSQNMKKPIEDKNDIMDLTQTDNHDNNYKTDGFKQNVTTNCLKTISQCSQGITRRNSDDFMEITKCVGIVTPKIYPKNDNEEISKFSQGSNKCRRYSEELMDVIQCVAISSQLDSNKDHLQATLTNLTKNKSDDLMEMTECVASTSRCIPLGVKANIDLTQNSDEGTTSLIGGIMNNVLERVDLSQSSNSDHELPIIQMTASSKSLDDTIILNIDEFVINQPSVSSVSTLTSKPSLDQPENTLDLTDTPPSPVKTHGYDKSPNKSCFDDFVHNHSDDTTEETIYKSIHSQVNHFVPKDGDDNDEVDLTQSYTSSVATIEQNSNNISIHTSKSSLGRKDDMSIDYDEMYDVIAYNGTKKDMSKSSVIHDLSDENEAKTDLENISLNSQVFDISDKEFEYSINQSRHDAACGLDSSGISVINSDFSVRKSEINVSNHTMSESFLPEVKVKSNNIVTNTDNRFITPITLLSKENAITPSKAFINDKAVVMDTPTNNEYIVKTDQVTPILDYASMSTPERNKELDKYGLKPFKRKRAIQLLTHLYNQTHPIVEACQEDLPSPSKRRKPSQPSPKKLKSPLKSPRKPLKSPLKMSQTAENVRDGINNNVYEVTNEIPEIKAIECCEEDLVFQKREKAKLHSCRVPLHIAFHNYVSCRRRLREAILRYDPVNIDVIHKELVATGHRYDPKELLKYLDKKCITVKTADNNARNNKR